MRLLTVVGSRSLFVKAATVSAEMMIPATGLPSVVASVGGFGEVVDGGVTGVPKEDFAAGARGIVELASNVETRRRMGAAACERVLERYTWSACVAAMSAVCGEVTLGAHP